MNLEKKENRVSVEVFDILFKVHRKLGPGLLESVYEKIICYELAKARIPYKRQMPIPVFYEEIKMDFGFRADIVIENCVLLELKSIEKINAVHYKTLQTYLKLADIKLGILINLM